LEKALRRIFTPFRPGGSRRADMIYLTGDTHGELERFKKGKLRWLGKKDTVIVLGDFGFFWNDSKAEQAARRWLEKRPYTLLFLDGCHDNFDLIGQYPEAEGFGGTVRPIGGNLYYVPRGQILEREGKKLLCFGGGRTLDREDRTAGENWWPQEMPDDAEMDACRQRLAAAGNAVDYILTHDAPEKLMGFAGVKTEDLSPLNDFFGELLTAVQYRKWFFGRYHRDIDVSAKARCVFTDVIPLKDE
jgi:hypothetical protein